MVGFHGPIYHVSCLYTPTRLVDYCVTFCGIDHVVLIFIHNPNQDDFISHYRQAATTRTHPDDATFTPSIKKKKSNIARGNHVDSEITLPEYAKIKCCKRGNPAEFRVQYASCRQHQSNVVRDCRR